MPDYRISKIASPLKVRGVGISIYKISEYVTVPLYFLGTRDSNKVLTYIRYKIYLVNSLRVKILISNNILGLEGFVINVAN